MNKIFDLRTVIGTFFLIIGLLLLIYSFFADSTLSIYININCWCGSIFSLFGAAMLLSLLFTDEEI